MSRSYKLTLDSDDENESDSDIENALSRRKPVLSEAEKVEQELYEHGLPPTPLKRSGLDKLQLQTEGLVNVNEDIGEEFWKTSWKQPSIPDAEAHLAANVPLHGRGHSFTTSITSFKDIPIGVRMYFQMLKSLFLAFLFCFLCSIPSLMFVYYGQGIHQEGQDTLGFYRFMLGNLGHSTLLGDGNYDYTWSPCSQNATTLFSYYATCLHVQSHSFTRPQVSFLITSMEIIQLLILLVTIVHIRRVYRRMCLEIDKDHQVCIQDYSVVVSGLPNDFTKEELVAHFSNLYQLSNVDFLGRMPIEDARPVQHCGNSQHTIYLNTFVADVFITRNLYPLLLLYKYKQQKQLSLYRLRALMKMTAAHTPHPKGYNEEKNRDYEEEMLRIARGLDRYMFAIRECALQSRKKPERSKVAQKDENAPGFWQKLQQIKCICRGIKIGGEAGKDKKDSDAKSNNGTKSAKSGKKSEQKFKGGPSKKSAKDTSHGEETKDVDVELAAGDAELDEEKDEDGDEEQGLGGMDKIQMDNEGEAKEFEKVALRITNNAESHKSTISAEESKSPAADQAPAAAIDSIPRMAELMNSLPPLSVILTFEYVESKVRCLKDYRKYSSIPYRLCIPSMLKFRGKHILKVEDAPAPRDILHHHLGTPFGVKLKLYLYVYGVVCLLVLGSIILCICAGMARHTYDNVIPSPDICSYVIPSAYTPSIAVANTSYYDKLEFMRPHPTYRDEYDHNCSQVIPGSVYLVYTHPSVYVSTSAPTRSPTYKPSPSPSIAPAQTRAPSESPSFFPTLNANDSNSPTFMPTSTPIPPFPHPTLFSYSYDRCVENNLGDGGYCPIGSETGDTEEVFCPCAYVYNNDDRRNEYRQIRCMSGACQLESGVVTNSHAPFAYKRRFGYKDAGTSLDPPALQCDGFKGDSMATCYCVSYIDNLLHTQGILTYLSYIFGSPSPPAALSPSSSSSGSRDEYSICSDVHSTIMYAFVFKYISIIYTILADQGIYYWLSVTAEHIPYTTKEQLYTNTFLSLTLARYFNLAFVSIIGYGMSVTLMPSLEPSFGVYGDATREWYGDGGYFLLCVYMLFTILPLVWELVWYYVVKPIRRHYILSNYRLKPSYDVAIQDDLNRLFLGPALPIHTLLSRVFVLVLFTFTYAAALPLMMPVTFFTLMLTYLLHRDMFLHYYKTVDFVGKGIVEIVFRILPFVCVARVIASCWILSADDIVPKEFPENKGLGAGSSGVSLGMLSFYNYRQLMDGLQKTQFLPDVVSVIEIRLKYIQVFPVFVLGVLIVIGLFIEYFYNFLGKYIIEDLGTAATFMYKKCFPGDPNKGRLTRHPNFLHAFDLFSTNDPSRQETAPYTGVYHKYLGRKNFKPSYWSRVAYYWKTKLCFCFASCMKDPNDRSKMYESLAIGWEVQDMGLDFEVKVKTWPSTDNDVNLMKLKGENKRTYEVIADAELPYCYNLELLPDYRFAYVNLQEYDMKYAIAAHYLTAMQEERQHMLFSPDIIENRLNKKDDGYRKNKIIPINRPPEHVEDQPLLPWQQKALEEDEEAKRKRLAKEKRGGRRGDDDDEDDDGMLDANGYPKQVTSPAYVPDAKDALDPDDPEDAGVQNTADNNKATVAAGKKFVVNSDESSGEEETDDDSDEDSEEDSDDDDDSSEEDDDDDDDGDEDSEDEEA